MEQHNDKRRISHQPSKRIGASLHMVDPFILHVPPLTHLPASARRLSPGDPIQPTVAENAFVQVIMMFRKAFIQGSVLMMELHPCYPIWQHLIFSDPAYLSFKRDMLQIEAQEYDPAHTLLQQCVFMHSRFQTPIGYKIIFLARPIILLLLPLVITFLPPHCHSLYSTTSNERTNEQTNERTNERDDDDANDDSTTTSCRPKSLFLNFQILPSHCTDKVHSPQHINNAYYY
ncbi:hypothetical protein [Absidia glauca]|uniref:Ndc10 domain-containing protein n=1 Tax=Absidia glauca TaxID=4829 RepID=A0A163K3Y2_ABSGL|nr:hypothetical protein [Absidia glauca]